MRTIARLLFIVLGLIAATGVFYAVQQQKSLRDARNAAESLEKERTELREKLREAERRRRELEERLRAIGATDGSMTIETESPEFAGAVPESTVPRNGPTRRDGPGRIMAALESPEAQRLLALQHKGRLDGNYAALFRRLNLSPEQLDHFKSLLVEKRTAMSDVMAAARSQGLTGRENRDEIRALVEATQAEIEDSIRALLGESGYQEYRQYEHTQPQRAIAEQLATRVSYLPGAQLTPQQADQLVQILATNTPPRPQNNGATVFPAINIAGTNPPGGISGGFNTTITDEAIQQAATVLSPAQLDALKQLQAEQQAQAQLNQIMRNQLRPRRGGGSPSASSATPPKD